MCDRSNGRPGLLRSAWDWLCGRPRSWPAPPTGDPDENLVGPDVRSHLPRCERCGAYRTEDESTMHRRWCEGCDLAWIEEQICAPLVARMGRRDARRALKALVRGEIR